MNCPKCNVTDVRSIGPDVVRCFVCGHTWNVPHMKPMCKEPQNLFLSKGGLVVNPK